jgi:hypothetical protein
MLRAVCGVRAQEIRPVWRIAATASFAVDVIKLKLRRSDRNPLA